MNKATIHPNGGMLTFCETYLCNKPANYFMGPINGPLKLMMNVCGDCRDSVLMGFIEEDPDVVLEKVREYKETQAIKDAKAKYNGKEFPCKKCGKVFYSPPMLASHTREVHKSEEVEEKSSA